MLATSAIVEGRWQGPSSTTILPDCKRSRKNCVGIWVSRPDKGEGREDKIAAIGVRIRRWVTFHGIALNVDPVLEHFSGIVPCGVSTQGVTSLADLGVHATMADVDAALRREFEPRFGSTARAG